MSIIDCIAARDTSSEGATIKEVRMRHILRALDTSASLSPHTFDRMLT
jgi:hypothetical protein